MHTPVRIALAVVLVATACRHSGANRLEGDWKGTKAEGAPPEMTAAANLFAAQLELVVNGDKLTVSTAKEKQAGRYKVVREDKNAIVIQTDKDGPGDTQTFTFVDPTTMKWQISDGKTITFSKIK